MKIKSTSIFNEDYKLKKAEKESSYFPQELQEILDGMGYEKPSKEYQGSYLFNKNDPDEMAIVNIVFKQRRDWVRDSEKSEYENLNPDRVGQDFFVQIIYTNTGSFGSNNPKKNITMKDILAHSGSTISMLSFITPRNITVYALMSFTNSSPTAASTLIP